MQRNETVVFANWCRSKASSRKAINSQESRRNLLSHGRILEVATCRGPESGPSPPLPPQLIRPPPLPPQLVRPPPQPPIDVYDLSALTLAQ